MQIPALYHAKNHDINAYDTQWAEEREKQCEKVAESKHAVR